ncbi:hypothetical protein L6241_10040 [Janibacter sp. Y6]|uniref:hypothetical protein n=1 Tax=Janibacter sp. Y6 TaxID=2913552 RepID=UPI0034A3AA0B
MDDVLTQLPWGSLGTTSVIVISVLALLRVSVLAIIRGELVPARTVEKTEADLRESLRLERVRNDQPSRALSVLALNYGTTADKVLTSLPLLEGQQQEPVRAVGGGVVDG